MRAETQQIKTFLRLLCLTLAVEGLHASETHCVLSREGAAGVGRPLKIASISVSASGTGTRVEAVVVNASPKPINNLALLIELWHKESFLASVPLAAFTTEQQWREMPGGVEWWSKQQLQQSLLPSQQTSIEITAPWSLQVCPTAYRVVYQETDNRKQIYRGGLRVEARFLGTQGLDQNAILDVLRGKAYLLRLSVGYNGVPTLLSIEGSDIPNDELEALFEVVKTLDFQPALYRGAKITSVVSLSLVADSSADLSSMAIDRPRIVHTVNLCHDSNRNEWFLSEGCPK